MHLLAFIMNYLLEFGAWVVWTDRPRFIPGNAEFRMWNAE
jgi:hypothetical protein